ncbi:MAG: hypothetical protein RDV48_03440 [Candidatus Eremiobacteraeota bacterium]|nr:hypothetical protein [Candidatus Eremiobacteraeota bacterium]
MNFLKKLFPGKRQSAAARDSGLFPESTVVLTVDDHAVISARPGGLTERVTWDELSRVEIMTTDEGPLVADVFWVLHGKDRGCVIPQGATNEHDLIEKLVRLPGFNHNEMIEAMASTENRTFLVWEKGGESR